jgi:hypothetical protein
MISIGPVWFPQPANVMQAPPGFAQARPFLPPLLMQPQQQQQLIPIPIAQVIPFPIPITQPDSTQVNPVVSSSHNEEEKEEGDSSIVSTQISEVAPVTRIQFLFSEDNQVGLSQLVASQSIQPDDLHDKPLQPAPPLQVATTRTFLFDDRQEIDNNEEEEEEKGSTIQQAHIPIPIPIPVLIPISNSQNVNQSEPYRAPDWEGMYRG